jgi:hypothetical protein
VKWSEAVEQARQLKLTPAQKRLRKQWNKKQALAYPARYVGDGGTIHHTTHLDVMVSEDGTVQAVWFRCQQLPFEQHEAGADDYANADLPLLTGVEVLDQRMRRQE